MRMANLAIYFGVAFVLHFAWEHLHMPLYDVPETNAWERIKICLFATATGDMIFMLVIYVAVAASERSIWWALSKRSYRHFSTWLLPMLVGLLLATSFELWAVYEERRWSYAEEMPLIPVLGVGVSPLLQMVVVPIATVALQWGITARLGFQEATTTDDGLDPNCGGALRPSSRRIVVVCVLASVLAEFGIFLVHGVWLHAGEHMLAKLVWTVGFCGLGMGSTVAAAIIVFFPASFRGRWAIVACGAISVLLLGVACNLLCLELDRHFNYFGGNENPVFFIGTGIGLAALGGLAAGAILFGGRRATTHRGSGDTRGS